MYDPLTNTVYGTAIANATQATVSNPVSRWHILDQRNKMAAEGMAGRCSVRRILCNSIPYDQQEEMIMLLVHIFYIKLSNMNAVR